MKFFFFNKIREFYIIKTLLVVVLNQTIKQIAVKKSVHLLQENQQHVCPYQL